MKRDHRLTRFNRLLAFEDRSFIKWKAFKNIQELWSREKLIAL